MTTKTTRALIMFSAGDFRGAFALFSTFRIGFTKEEQRTLKIASETFGGHGEFYKSIGIDKDAAIERGKEIIRTKYENNETEINSRSNDR